MKHKITLEFDDSANPIACGFRVGWMSGTRGNGKKKEDIDLSCGAGTGTPFLVFSKTIVVKGKPKTAYAVADIRKILPQLETAVAGKLSKP